MEGSELNYREEEDGEDIMFAEEARVASGNTYTAGFSIPRKCTIDSDNMSHKVCLIAVCCVCAVQALCVKR